VKVEWRQISPIQTFLYLIIVCVHVRLTFVCLFVCLSYSQPPSTRSLGLSIDSANPQSFPPGPTSQFNNSAAPLPSLAAPPSQSAFGAATFPHPSPSAFSGPPPDAQIDEFTQVCARLCWIIECIHFFLFPTSAPTACSSYSTRIECGTNTCIFWHCI
jgi:hypothetical protein